MCAFLLCSLGSKDAYSRPIEKLTHTLLHHSSYKVRLQAAVVLARLSDARSFNALVKCLEFDDNHLVRAVCATAVGSLKDPKGIKPLKESSRKDKHPYVRKSALSALKMLEKTLVSGAPRDWRKPPKRHTKYFVRLGHMSGSNRRIHNAYRHAMRDAFKATLGRERKVEMGIPSDKPPARFLRKHRIKAFHLDATLVKLKVKNHSDEYMVTALIRASLSNYPASKILILTSASASASRQVHGDLTSGQKKELFHRLKLDAVSEATQSVARNVWSYLKKK